MARKKRSAAQSASELAQMLVNAGRRSKGKPRGKPFPKGNKLGKKIPKGETLNPGGRPSAKEFRQACQDAALEVLGFWKEVGTGKRKATPAQVRAGEMVVTHGGYQKATQKIGGDEDAPLKVDIPGMERIGKMTTGALRRELDALRKRREEMTAGRKQPAPKEEAPAPAPSDAPSSDSDAR